MKFVLSNVLRVIGWKKLLLSVWDLVDDDLRKHAKKTDNQVDDQAIEILDGLIKSIASEK